MVTLPQKRHTLAHLLAAVIIQRYPDTLCTIGPAIENGFYYDFEFKSHQPSEDDLKEIESEMRRLLPEWKEFSHKKVTSAEAKKIFANNPYKSELIDEIVERGEEITLYTCGAFTDLCRGGHAENPSAEIATDSFLLERIAGAYWRGNEKNTMLTRIYGVAFDTKKELDDYTVRQEEAKKRDHKKLGPELDLFFIDEKVGKGLPMWTPKGTAVKYELEKYTREIERKYGYEHVATAYLGADELYRTSGHLDHYTHSMYAPIDMDGNKFYLRPMACPHHIRMYQRKPWSYRDLPVRYAEIADYNRYEKSGELMGMIRVRKFQLTDGHLFVTPEGLKDEFKQVCKMIVEAVTTIGLIENISYRFSKRDPNNKEKYYPDDALWDHTEQLMRETLDELGLSYVEAQDEAAFYGPKLDVQAKNVNGKEDTLFTAQMDFLLPQKFEIEYIDADGKKKRPMMIHRSTLGCLERTFAFLIEHFAGAFPLWLSPIHARVLPISEKHIPYARSVLDTLTTAGLRVDTDATNESLGRKIREAKMQKIPYLIIIGDEEMNTNTVTVESRDTGGKLEIRTTDALSEFLKEKVATRALS